MRAEVERLFFIIRQADGLTITDIVNKSPFTRSKIRTMLAMLEGADRINFKQIGMAKVYYG